MKTTRLSALLLLTVLATSCSAVKTPSDLLRAPLQDTADGTISGIVNPFLPANAHLTVPVQSQSGSAIQLQDLDQDGQDEILAFYKTDKTDYEVNALVLSQKDGAWKKLTTITGVGSELDYVQFIDVTADGSTDMLLGFSGGAGLSKELSVYSLKNSQLTEILKQPYDYMVVGDITNEGKSEIALFQSSVTNDTQPGSNLQLIDLSGGQLQILSSQSIDGTVIQVLFDKASPAGTGLFVDVAIGAHSSYTALLTWDHGAFMDKLAANNYHHLELANSKDIELGPQHTAQAGIIGEHNMAVKDYPLYSTDINGDGIIEVGFLVPPAGMESMAPLATPFISKYYQWDGGSKLNFKKEQFDRWGFNFHIPQNWAGKYTLEVPTESPAPWESIQFSYTNGASGEPVPLLKLRLLLKKDWNAAESKLRAEHASYKMLYEVPNTEDITASNVVVAVLPAAEEASKLSGAALQEYQQLQLTLDEVQNLAGTPQKPIE